MWDAESGKPVGEPMRHESRVSGGKFQSGRAADRHRISRQDRAGVGRGERQAGGQANAAMRARLRAASFSPDGRRIVTASDDKTARVWDAESGKPVGEPMRHEDAVRAASFSPDGRRIVTASEDKTARVWDAESGKPVGEPMRHEDTVRRQVSAADGRGFRADRATDRDRL